MNQQEIDSLYDANATELENMATAAGSMVDALINKAQRNGPIYFKLANGSGHQITFELVEGTLDRLQLVGKSLGLNVTESLIIVPDR